MDHLWVLVVDVEVLLDRHFMLHQVDAASNPVRLDQVLQAGPLLAVSTVIVHIDYILGAVIMHFEYGGLNVGQKPATLLTFTLKLLLLNLLSCDEGVD